MVPALSRPQSPLARQFDLFTLLLLPMFLAFGFVLAYSVLIWTYWAADQIGYYSVSILFHLPNGFGTSLFHLPGIVSLYGFVFLLGVCRHPIAMLAGWVLICDWIFAVLSLSNLIQVGIVEPLSLSWRSMLLIAFAIVPLYWGRSFSADLSSLGIERVRKATVIGLVLSALIAFIGFHIPPAASSILPVHVKTKA